MLAACRTQGDPYTVPPFDLTPDDVDGFLDELQDFHEAFPSCFVRSEPRQHFFHYMAGQSRTLKRKSIEPMAIHIEGGNIRGMQRFITTDVWKEQDMQRIYHDRVAHDMAAGRTGYFESRTTGIAKPCALRIVMLTMATLHHALLCSHRYPPYGKTIHRYKM